MSEITISDLSFDDIDSILTIENRSFSQPWNRTAFLAELSSKHGLSYVVKNNRNRIIAYSCIRVFEDEVHILKIAVSPKWRCQMTGTWLIRKCLKNACEMGAKKAYLEVRPSNIPARSFYDKLGFNIVGQRPKYYSDTGENALVLMKELKEET